MRFATILEDDRPVAALVRRERILSLAALPGLGTVRAIAAAGEQGQRQVTAFADAASPMRWRALAEARLGPAVADPGAIYTVGMNYPPGDAAPGTRPERPLIYGKLPTAVAGQGDTVAWDRSLSPNVDAEVELGVVIGTATEGPVTTADATDHVFGWTCINDISSRDEWLDGDQWLLGKSMAGFCPVGPSIVTPDELEARDVRLTATINGQLIQDGRSSRAARPAHEVVPRAGDHARAHFCR